MTLIEDIQEAAEAAEYEIPKPPPFDKAIILDSNTYEIPCDCWRCERKDALYIGLHITGTYTSERVEFDVACQLKGIAFRQSLYIATQLAMRKLRNRSTDSLEYTHGGNIYGLWWPRAPLWNESKRDSTSDGTPTKCNRFIEVRFRIPFDNPFIAKYELVASEHHTNKAEGIDHSRECVMLQSTCQFEFAKLICRWHHLQHVEGRTYYPTRWRKDEARKDKEAMI